jgi:tight adherence protein C
VKKKEEASFVSKFLKRLSVDWDQYRITFEQAGFRDSDAQKLFFYGKFSTTAVMFLVGLSLVELSPALALKPLMIKVAMILVSTIMGWFLFDLLLKNMIKSRVEQFEKHLPDVLDLMMICVETGLSFNKSLDRVAKEMATFSKDVSRELTVTAVEMELLLDRRQALVNMISRVPSTSVRSFATSMIQSMQQGTSLRGALSLMSQEIRESRMQVAETKAAKLPSLLVIPLMLFIFPNLFIVLLGPSLVQLTRHM